MRFAHPVWLASLAFILLLLLARYRRVRLQVANLYLWKDEGAETATPLARRFRRQRLLILQAGVLALIGLALATPLVTSRMKEVAVIVDLSMSMAASQAGGSRLEQARAEIETLLDTLPASASVRLLAATVTPSTIGAFTAGSTELRAAIAALTATDGDSDIGAALQSAFAAAVSPERVYVFTDSAPPGGLPSTVVWSNAGRPANNLAVTALTTRKAADTGSTHVLATVSNFGDTAVQTVLTLTVNERPAGEQALSVPASGSTRATFSVAEERGIATARLQHTDALAADNVRMAPLTPPQRTRVRVVTERSQSEFIEKALAANDAVDLVREAGAESDVVVCAGCTEPARGREGVLLIPPSQFDGTPAPLVRSSAEHRIAADLVMDGVLAQPLRALEPAPDGPGVVVARAGDLPAIVAYDLPSRRIVELRVDPAAQPLVLSTAFPILIANAVEWLAEPGRETTSIIAGQPLHFVSRTSGEPEAVVGPNGQKVGAASQNGIVTVSSTNTAGVYRFQSREVVVNPSSSAESDLRVRANETATNEAVRHASEAAPNDLTAPLLVAALLLLAFEWHYRTA